MIVPANSSIMSDALLRVEGITKRFGRFSALSEVSFSVRRGEILGLIGLMARARQHSSSVLPGSCPPVAEPCIMASVPSHPVIAHRFCSIYLMGLRHGQRNRFDGHWISHWFTLAVRQACVKTWFGISIWNHFSTRPSGLYRKANESGRCSRLGFSRHSPYCSPTNPSTD